MKILRGICFVLVVLAATQVSLSGQILSDGTFNPSNYTVDSLPEGGATAAVVTDTQMTSGGNPGDFLQLTFQQSVADTGGNYPVDAAVINTSMSYNPATQGAIATLTLQADLQGVTPVLSSAELYLEQGGVLYAFGGVLNLNGTWRTLSGVGSASDFVSDSLTHPNFSSSGAPIYFGVGQEESSNAAINQTFNVDNLQATVTAAPEPSAVVLALGGVAWVMMLVTVRSGRRA